MNENTTNDRMNELLAHSGWVHGLALRLVRDPGAADDLVQETWLAALRKPPRDDRPVRGWLAGVVRNLARQRRRSEGRRARREEGVGAQRAPLPSTDKLAERMETQRDLAEAILQLAEPWRATVIVRYLEGLSSAEIARRENVPAATVRGRLKRALEELRTTLDDRHGGDRRVWTALLLPFLSKPTPGGPARLNPTAEASSRVAPLTLTAKLVWGGTLLLALLGVVFGVLSISGALPLFGPAEDEEEAPTAANTPDRPRGPTLEAHGPTSPPPTLSAAEQLDEALGALRTLVGHPAWAVNELRIASNAKDLPEGCEDERAFSAALGGHQSMVMGLIYRFKQPQQASAYVASARDTVEAQIKEMAAMGLPAGAMTLGEGAGSDNALRGIHTQVRLSMTPGRDLSQDTQKFSLGRFAVVLQVMGTPKLDRAAQDEAIDYVAAFLSDPVAARKRPPPTPQSFEGMGRVLEVRIEGPDGEPLPRVLGVVRRPDASSFRTSLQQGAGVLPLPATGAVEMFVLSATDADGEPLPLGPAGPIAVDEGQTQINVRLERGLTIAGRMRTPEGQPANGIQIEARFGKDPGAPVPAGPRGPDPARVWSNVVPDPYTTTRATADGAFELVGLVEGPYRLRFLRGDEVASADEPVVSAGTTDVEIDLRPTRVFRLTLLDPDGKAVPNASVSIRAEGRLPVRVQSDEKGVATLQGLDVSHTYRLWVSGPRDDLLSIRRKGWKPRDETIQFDAGWTLRGVVRDAQGQPLRAWVYHGGLGEQTEADGTFELYQLPQEGTRVAVFALGSDMMSRDPEGRTIAPTKELVVFTITEKLLTVRVTDPKGDPVPNASLTIELLDASGRVSRTRTEDVKSGVWRGAHPAGPFAVEVYQAESDAWKTLGFAPARREGLGRADHEVALRLAPGGRVTGRVLDAKGKPVVDLQLGALPMGVRPVRAEESLVLRAHAWTQTASDGTFTLEGLGTGRYELRLKLPDSMAEPNPLQVEAGQRDVEVVLPAR